MPRLSRAAQQRNLQSRRAEQRPAVQNEPKDILWLPTPPAGMEYGWIRRAVLNQEDAFNIRTRQLQGWKPVPASRHPEMSPQGWGLVQGEALGYIEVAGLIMCECPKKDLDARRRAQAETNAAALRMPHIAMEKGAKAPTWDESNVGFERVITEKNTDQEFKD